MNLERIINFILTQLLCWIPDKNLRKSTRSRYTKALMKISHRHQIRAYKRSRKKRSNAKILVYSAIAGSYDNPQEHTFINKEWDYRLYTDQDIDKKKKKECLWDIVRIKNEEGSDPNRTAKEYKILPHRFIRDYDYSIWIDGNIKIIGPHLNRMFYDFLGSEKILGISQHPTRSSVGEEIDTCLKLKKDSAHKITTWKQTLENENFPDNQGLFEMNVIIRKHKDNNCMKIMEEWWKIIQQNSKRDQLSFSYAIWKSAKKVSTVAFVNECPIRKIPDYKLKEHKSK